MQFFSSKNTLDIMSEKKYGKIAARYERWRRYYPGKYSALFVKSIIKSVAFEKFDFFKTEGLSEMPVDMEVKIFLNAILSTSHPPLNGVDIIVLGEAEFLIALEEEIVRSEYPEYIRGISVVDYMSKADKECYYILDDHMNSKGHKIIAQEILHHMGYH
jgi:hypothetical protein